MDANLGGAEVWAIRADVVSRFWTGYGREVARRGSEFVAGCDVVHIHELWHYPHYAIFRAASRRSLPIVVTPHGALDPWVLRYKRTRKKLYAALFQRRTLHQATFVQALTPSEADAIACFGVSRERIRIIPNGLPEATVKSLAEQRQEISRRGQVADDYGLFLGRIHPKKGLDLLVRSLPYLVAKHPNIRIVVAGPDEGGHQAKIERLASTLGVRDRLTFTGLVTGNEKWKLLAGAGFFVLPSYSEGFSMALLEALAAGVPVVATKACEVGALQSRDAAILVDPVPEALAQGISAVLIRPDLACRLSENSRRLVLERYTWETIAVQVLQMYEEAIELHSVGARKYAQITASH